MRWPDRDTSIFPLALARVCVRGTGTEGEDEGLKDLSPFSETPTNQALCAPEILQGAACKISEVSRRMGPPGRLKASLGPTEEQAIATEFVSSGSRLSPLAHRSRHVAPGRVRRARGGHGATEARNAAEANVAPSCASPVHPVNRGEGHVA